MTNQKKSGFTLIELLVVIAIIGLIAGIATVSLSQSRRKARDTKRMSDIKQIDSAIQLYIIQNGHAPFLSNTCSANNAAQDCFASSRKGNWRNFSEDIKPFLKKEVPTDPCGTECGTDRSYTYRYTAPGGIAAWCQSFKCASTTDELNSMYQIYAEALETQLGHWGFQEALGNSL